jgi:hypothetical protein
VYVDGSKSKENKIIGADNSFVKKMGLKELIVAPRKEFKVLDDFYVWHELFCIWDGVQLGATHFHVKNIPFNISPVVNCMMNSVLSGTNPSIPSIMDNIPTTKKMLTLVHQHLNNSLREHHYCLFNRENGKSNS